MQQRIVLAAVAGALFSTAIVLAEGLPSHPMSYFIVSAVPGAERFSGFVGADQLCQTLAQAAGLGSHIWHARLAVNGRSSEGGVTNKDGGAHAEDTGHFYCFTMT